MEKALDSCKPSTSRETVASTRKKGVYNSPVIEALSQIPESPLPKETQDMNCSLNMCSQYEQAGTSGTAEHVDGTCTLGRL